MPPSTRKLQRQQKFRDLAALKVGDPDVSDYHTGRTSEFELRGRAVNDDSQRSQYEPCMEPCCRMLIRSEGGINSHFPDAPQTKTLQFERTIRNWIFFSPALLILLIFASFGGYFYSNRKPVLPALETVKSVGALRLQPGDSLVLKCEYQVSQWFTAEVERKFTKGEGFGGAFKGVPGNHPRARYRLGSLTQIMSNAQVREAFIAADVRISIDDLNLTVTATSGKAQYRKVYEVGYLPMSVLAFIHHMQGDWMALFVDAHQAAKLLGYSIRHFRRVAEQVGLREKPFGSGRRKFFYLRSDVEKARAQYGAKA